MDTKSGNKGKRAMNDISGNRPAHKGFRAFDGESLNQAPPPITMSRNEDHMVPPNPRIYGEPLDVVPLTVAMPGEPVAHTPSSIIKHPAYNGGWKVLQRSRAEGRVDKTYHHKDFGRFRSKKAVMIHLDKLWSLQNIEQKSEDHDKQSSVANQSAEGHITAVASQSAGGKDAAATNDSAEGNSPAGASCSSKGKSAA